MDVRRNKNKNKTTGMQECRNARMQGKTRALSPWVGVVVLRHARDGSFFGVLVGGLAVGLK